MKVTITLPDGSTRQYPQPVSALQVARDLSARLAKAAVAAQIDGQLCDLTATIPDGTHELKIVTDRDEAAREVLRHTAAHVMAQAVVRLYGPGVQYAIGPALMEDFQYGFYYDFDLPRPLGQEDLQKVEQEMRKIVADDLPITREELGDKAIFEVMDGAGQTDYKGEIIDGLIREHLEAGKDLNRFTASIYRQGDFVDLCRGPHLPSTGKLAAFKLLTTAGAYWRGDESRKMLTRIYGVAFFSDPELQEHLSRIAEAKKRDHRTLGRQLGLFLISEAVGPGLPLWMPKGTIIRRELESWLRSELDKRGYQAVVTPHIGRLDLYRTSGHYPYYKDSQFPPIQFSETEGYLLKPMNCPHHIEIYKAAQHSYRELPIRLSEFGVVYRLEQSGELSGLIRVRGFTQDDAHIFCTPEQLEAEIASCVELTQLVLNTLGLTDYRVRIGLRGQDASKYVGNSANWDQAEANIRHVVQSLGLKHEDSPGEAAFYGPKIDFMAKDCLGREWQLGTIQVDYNLPERFELEYTAADNSPHRPVMIHRAPLGSPERFIGILIEHFAGAFPLWLSPVQAAVLPVSDKVADYAASVAAAVRQAGIRTDLDDSPEKIGAKIRRATLAKTPYMAVVGAREAESATVAVRHRTTGDLGAMKLEAFVAALRKEIDSKGATPLAPAKGP
ncbi:MAG: threonine--tRNA ligase [Phycisphaerae bacterium]|nr:threonine--tRNA ligase [Phycisphaerae bacterium]